jgi:hypothetical protein
MGGDQFRFYHQIKLFLHTPQGLLELFLQEVMQHNLIAKAGKLKSDAFTHHPGPNDGHFLDPQSIHLFTIQQETMKD